MASVVSSFLCILHSLRLECFFCGLQRHFLGKFDSNFWKIRELKIPKALDPYSVLIRLMQQFLCILIRESTTFVTFSECINSQCYENIIWSKSRAQRWCLTLRCISTPTNWSIDCDQCNIYTQWTHRLHCTLYKSISSIYRSHNIESHSKQVAQIARRTVLVLHLNFFLFFGHLHFIPLHHQRVNKPRCDRVCVVCTPHTPAHCAYNSIDCSHQQQRSLSNMYACWLVGGVVSFHKRCYWSGRSSYHNSLSLASAIPIFLWSWEPNIARVACSVEW